MAIDFKKNKDALNKAVSQIVDTNDDTNWGIFGYEGQTTVLKVVGTGDGGIDEMSEDLSAGKMLYAYCSVKDSNTDLNKYVLVHWTGESVPENVKLKYTTHLRDVQAFLRGVHVTVVARTETDIDEDDIRKKVAKASGANYSVHKEKATKEESPAPVGTDYKRVRPDREINLNARDKFWSQAEKDEISRQNENKSKLDEERKHLEEERKDREQLEAKERDRLVSERMRGITDQKLAEKKANRQDNEDEKRKWAQVQKESSIDEEERGHRSDQMRRERVDEAAKLASSSTAKSRDFFKQKSTERPQLSNKGPPPVRKLRNEFGNSDGSDQPVARKEPIQLPTDETSSIPSKPVFQPQEPQQETEPEPQPQRIAEPDPEPVAPAPSQPQTRDLLRQGLPPRQESDPEDDQDWDEQPEDSHQEQRVPPVHEEVTQHYDPAPEANQTNNAAQDYGQDVYENQQPNTYEQNNHPVEEAGGATDAQGLCARALYDYQAADDTEISFDPEEIITNIEQIDEGWWQGFSPDGSYGMFPANYVEIIN